MTCTFCKGSLKIQGFSSLYDCDCVSKKDKEFIVYWYAIDENKNKPIKKSNWKDIFPNSWALNYSCIRLLEESIYRHAFSCQNRWLEIESGFKDLFLVSIKVDISILEIIIMNYHMFDLYNDSNVKIDYIRFKLPDQNKVFERKTVKPWA